MIEQYIPIFMVMVFAIIFGLGVIFASKIFGPNRPNKFKLMPYESGKDPVGDARERMSIKYYLVAMLFIIFDIEVIFVYPWGVEFKKLFADFGILAFTPMLVFLIVLELGFLYIYVKGGLKWD
ncbi:MAG: NADH-quinone oxidoreductase subunit A [Melioribacteraceae bacterium]|nr:NADH-quinone oxidoreductase subunit A [Melioribacteraceae bacterium]MCF8264612.1 NADH-quinone oxidoreductase subunit A [Melioribacteraceae bacterium]MCF8414459.1 NADH-quinone oxidoreductase subunit A [Melioribacteraceae bacterium]